MEGAYRSPPEAVAPRADDVRWRVRVARAVGILIVLFIVEGVVKATGVSLYLELVESSSAYAVIFRVAFFFVTTAVAAVEAAYAWILTEPRPGAESRLAFRVWILRGFATASVGVRCLSFAIPLLYTPTVEAYDLVALAETAVFIGLGPAGLWFMSGLFREVGHPESAGHARNVAVLLLLCRAFTAFTPYEDRGLLFGLAAVLGLGGLLLGLKLVIVLRRALRVALHEWWVDATDVTSPKFASLVVSGRDLAEAMTAGGERIGFSNKLEAEIGLRERGWIKGEQAVAQGVVQRLPPAPL